MIDEIRKVSLAPRSFFPRLRQAQEAAEILRRSLKREPDSAEIAAKLGWPEETLEKVWSSYNLLTVLSLEKLLFEKAGGGRPDPGGSPGQTRGDTGVNLD